MKPRLLYIVTEDWFFLTHFLPLARSARDTGFDVVVVARDNGLEAQFAAEGFRLISLQAERKSANAFSMLGTVKKLREILRDEQPNVIHAIALKSVVLGGIANLLAGRDPQLLSLTGLGYLWTKDLTSFRVLRHFVRVSLSYVGKIDRTTFTFENDEDAREFPELEPKVVIGGWGLDANEIVPSSPPPLPPIRVVYLGRMLRAKGIDLAVEAILLARRTVNVELELWGSPDEGNFTSYTNRELEALSELEGVLWRGRCNDVRDAWNRAHIAILLSDREGLPRSLIEAQAAGLPSIASDVPGCRSVITSGRNGILVPLDDVAQVATAIVKLASDAELRKAMGRAARTDFETRFSTENVIPRLTALYLSLWRPQS